MTIVHADAPSHSPGRVGMKWHHAYFLLAAFSLCTVSWSLFLNHRLVAMHKRIVEGNLQWVARLTVCDVLAKNAGAVNVPAHDALQSRDVEAGSVRMRAAQLDFNQAFADLLQKLPSDLLPKDAALLRSDYASVRNKFIALVGNADFIFSLIREGKFDQADAQVVALSHSYDDVLRALDATHVHLHALRKAYLDSQTVETRHLARSEWILGALIVLMVVGTTVYGRRLERHVSASETALREREAVSSAIVNSAADGITLVDAETLHFAEFNDAACQGLGYTREEFAQITLPDIQSSLTVEEVVKRVEEIVRNGDGHFEDKQRCKDGSLRDVRVADRVVQIHGRNYLVAVWQDITERKKTEQEMRWKTVFFKAVVHSSLDGIMVVDGQGRGVVQNQQFTKLLKIPQAIVEKADNDAQFQYLVNSAKHPEQFLDRVLYLYSHPDETSRDVIEFKDGRVLDRCSSPVLGKDGKYYGRIWSFRDITEQKRAEETQAEQHTLLRTLIDTIPDRIYAKDTAARFILNNAAHLQALGARSQDDARGKTDFDFRPAQLATKYLADDQAVLHTGQPVNDRETFTVSPTGEKVWMLVTKAPLRDAEGKVVGLVGISRNITERKRAEEAIDRDRNLLRTVIETVPDRIYAKDTEARFILNNAAHLHALGAKSQEEVAGKTDFDFRRPEIATRCIADDRKVIDSGQSLNNREEQTILPNGEPGWLLANKVPLRNPEGKIVGLVGISRDITQRKQADEERMGLELQLRQSQKLEAVGRLAAGIAHEINTPTQYVSDNTRFVQESFCGLKPVIEQCQRLLEAAKQNAVTPEVVREVEAAMETADVDYLMGEVPKAVQQSLDGLQRVAKIVKAMKDFSHPGSEQKTAIDLNQAIESTVTVARNEWKYVADLETDFDAALPPVPCLPGEFNQVILNLLINAAHAIGDVVGHAEKGKGKITVSTRRVNGSAEVRIGDTGTGIPEAARPKVFDPFFTTKALGKGTGQGLAIAHSVVVDKHGGSIDFETETGKGTTFIIRLPLANQPVAKKAS